ncbi:MAG: hypothetical protein Kow0026_27550 [Oricola sp.]
MPRAPEPHTPDIDLAARRAVAAEGVLTPELEAFCQGGVSVVLAASLRGEPPVAGIGYGCRVLPGGRMRILLQRAANAPLLDLARRGAGLAATFSQPFTHRSIQVKGSGAVVAEPGRDDLSRAVRQADGLRRELVEVQYAPDFAAAYCTVDEADLAAIDITLDSAFVQTPGPGAGAELKP